MSECRDVCGLFGAGEWEAKARGTCRAIAPRDAYAGLVSLFSIGEEGVHRAQTLSVVTDGRCGWAYMWLSPRRLVVELAFPRVYLYVVYGVAMPKALFTLARLKRGILIGSLAIQKSRHGIIRKMRDYERLALADPEQINGFEGHDRVSSRNTKTYLKPIDGGSYAAGHSVAGATSMITMYLAVAYYRASQMREK